MSMEIDGNGASLKLWGISIATRKTSNSSDNVSSQFAGHWSFRRFALWPILQGFLVWSIWKCCHREPLYSYLNVNGIVSERGKAESKMINDVFPCMKTTNNHNVDYFSHSPRYFMVWYACGLWMLLIGIKMSERGVFALQKKKNMHYEEKYYSCRHIRIIYANQLIHFHKQLN